MERFLSAGFEIAFARFAAKEEAAQPRLPILLIHGFASNHRVNWVDTGWTRTLTEAGYNVVALDNRGHGASGKSTDPSDYSAPTMADDARRLLHHLGIARAHVMGYSMGARITAFLSMADGPRVATAAFAGLGINMIKGLGGSDEIAAALEADDATSVTASGPRMFRLFAEQTKSHLPSLAACIRSSRAQITEDAISKLAMPVLVAVGTDDAVAGSGRDLANLIPSARAFDIEGRDHMKSVGDLSYKAAYLDFLSDTARSLRT